MQVGAADCFVAMAERARSRSWGTHATRRTSHLEQHAVGLKVLHSSHEEGREGEYRGFELLYDAGGQLQLEIIIRRRRSLGWIRRRRRAIFLLLCPDRASSRTASPASTPQFLGPCGCSKDLLMKQSRACEDRCSGHCADSNLITNAEISHGSERRSQAHGPCHGQTAFVGTPRFAHDLEASSMLLRWSRYLETAVTCRNSKRRL